MKALDFIVELENAEFTDQDCTELFFDWCDGIRKMMDGWYNDNSTEEKICSAYSLVRMFDNQEHSPICFEDFNILAAAASIKNAGLDVMSPKSWETYYDGAVFSEEGDYVWPEMWDQFLDCLKTCKAWLNDYAGHRVWIKGFINLCRQFNN